MVRTIFDDIGTHNFEAVKGSAKEELSGSVRLSKGAKKGIVNALFKAIKGL